MRNRVGRTAAGLLLAGLLAATTLALLAAALATPSLSGPPWMQAPPDPFACRTGPVTVATRGLALGAAGAAVGLFGPLAGVGVTRTPAA